VTSNGTRRAWYLHLDVRGFFVTLDRRVLWNRLAAVEPDPAVRWLLRLILFHEPTENCRLRGARRADFLRLPAHRTLFRASAGYGLPIGNQTSQFGANVYLDALHQFIKHELKARYYVRYCDDMVLLSTDAAELAAWERAIGRFLDERLRLGLNDRRKLRPASGRAVFPWPWPLLEQVRQWLGSCLVHFERASGSAVPFPASRCALRNRRRGFSSVCRVTR